MVTVQFAFFNLITWAPWMLLGPVLGHAYLGGAAVWGAIMAMQGAGAIVAGLASLGRKPARPMVVATIGSLSGCLATSALTVPEATKNRFPPSVRRSRTTVSGPSSSRVLSGNRTTAQLDLPEV